MERPSEQRRAGERRRLWDRRAPGTRRTRDDRRERERRAAELGPPRERRAGDDRRGNERRGEAERRLASSRRRGRRRRETPTPYTTEQIAELRGNFAAPGVVGCPACGSRYTLGPGRKRGAENPRRVMCLGCGRAAVVPNSRAARILVIANNGSLRDTLHATLDAAGHEVIEAAEAAVALAAYQTVPADVVIIDVQVSGRMDAPEFLRRLRRLFPDARVVALAGRPSFREVDRLAVTHGLGAHTLRVPFTRELLIQTVEEARK